MRASIALPQEGSAAEHPASDLLGEETWEKSRRESVFLGFPDGSSRWEVTNSSGDPGNPPGNRPEAAADPTVAAPTHSPTPADLLPG